MIMTSERFKASQQELLWNISLSLSFILLSLPLRTCLPFSFASNPIPREGNAYLHGIFINREIPSPPFALGMQSERGARFQEKVHLSSEIRSTPRSVCYTLIRRRSHGAFRLSRRYCITIGPLLACRFSSWPSAYSARQDFTNAVCPLPTAD